MDHLQQLSDQFLKRLPQVTPASRSVIIITVFSGVLYALSLVKLEKEQIIQILYILPFFACFSIATVANLEIKNMKKLEENSNSRSLDISEYPRNHKDANIQIHNPSIHLQAFTKRDNIFENSGIIYMAAINFFGLREFSAIIKDAIKKNKAQFRIALLKPGCEAFKLAMEEQNAADREKQCKDAIQVVETLEMIQDWINLENKKLEQGNEKLMPNIELYYYERIAYCGLIITDDIIRYWPYLNHPVTDSPSFDFDKKSEYAKFYTSYFIELTNKKNLIKLETAKNEAKDFEIKYKEKQAENANLERSN